MFMLCLLGFAACYKCYGYRDWLRVYVTSTRIGCMSMIRLQGLAAYLYHGYRNWLPVSVTSMRIGCMSMLRLQGLAACLFYVYQDWLHVYVTATGIGCIFMLWLQGMATYLSSRLPGPSDLWPAPATPPRGPWPAPWSGPSVWGQGGTQRISLPGAHLYKIGSRYAFDIWKKILIEISEIIHKSMIGR